MSQAADDPGSYDRLLHRLHGADLAYHLELAAEPLTLKQLAIALPKVPDGARAGLISHFLDRVARHPGCAGDTNDDEPAHIIMGHLHTLDASGGRALERDLLQLLDVALRQVHDVGLAAACLGQLAQNVGWLSTQTLAYLADISSESIHTALAQIVGSSEALYHTFNETGPYPQGLHQLAHDRHLAHLVQGDRVTPLDSARLRSGSTLWQQRTSQGEASSGRRWDERSIAALIARYQSIEQDASRLQQWHAQLMAATSNDGSGIASLLAPDEAPGPGGASWAVVCTDLESLMVFDRVDVDLAAPVWALTAAARGSAQSVPLAHMHAESRMLVWDQMWYRWLSEGGTSRWPIWCPWPRSSTLEQAPALLLHAGLPHPDPNSWLRQRIFERLNSHPHTTSSRTGSYRVDSCLVDDAYCQALGLSVSWGGTLGSLLDACAASLTPPRSLSAR